jgi:hypothetical protein
MELQKSTNNAMATTSPLSIWNAGLNNKIRELDPKVSDLRLMQIIEQHYKDCGIHEKFSKAKAFETASRISQIYSILTVEQIALALQLNLQMAFYKYTYPNKRGSESPDREYFKIKHYHEISFEYISEVISAYKDYEADQKHIGYLNKEVREIEKSYTTEQSVSYKSIYQHLVNVAIKQGYSPTVFPTDELYRYLKSVGRVETDEMWRKFFKEKCLIDYRKERSSMTIKDVLTSTNSDLERYFKRRYIQYVIATDAKVSMEYIDELEIKKQIVKQKEIALRKKFVTELKMEFDELTPTNGIVNYKGHLLTLDAYINRRIGEIIE